MFVSAKGIGCFKDPSRRAIATLEGKSRLLKGSYRRRPYAIKKCALSAERRGYKVFAVQHGGWCAASRTAYRTYAKYGKSNRCRNGKGGPWSNDVYFLKGRFTLPNSSTLRVINMEGKITECWMSMRKLIFFVNFACEEGKITHLRLSSGCLATAYAIEKLLQEDFQ